MILCKKNFQQGLPILSYSCFNQLKIYEEKNYFIGMLVFNPTMKQKDTSIYVITQKLLNIKMGHKYCQLKANR